MRSSLLLLLALGCSDDKTAGGVSDHVSAPMVDTSEPTTTSSRVSDTATVLDSTTTTTDSGSTVGWVDAEQVLELSVDPLLVGTAVPLVVRGATPGDTVQIWRGTLGDLSDAPQSCVPELAVCLGIEDASLLVDGVADAAGEVHTSWAVNEPLGDYPLLQAVSGSEVSQRVMRRVVDVYPHELLDSDPFDDDDVAWVGDGDWYDLKGDRIDVFQFSVAAGQELLVHLVADSVGDLYYGMDGPRGNYVPQQFTPNDSALRWLTTQPYGGTYELSLEDEYAGPHWGHYDLRVRITDPATPSTWYIDADRDGFGDPATAFVDLNGTRLGVANGDDCDDTSAAFRPFAYDTCDDGLDQDCSGADRVCGDGLDDGTTQSLDEIDLVQTVGSEPYVVGADTDGDGRHEVWVGEGFGVAELPVDVPGVVQTTETYLDACCPGYQGMASAGDPSGDGADDLWIPDYTAGIGGEVYLVHGGTPGGRLADVAATRVWAPADAQLISVATGELDGDGAADVVFGGDEASTVWLLPGPVPTGDVELDAVAPTRLHGALDEQAGFEVGLADLDGDGLDEVWIERQYGGAYLASGPLQGVIDLTQDAAADIAGVRNLRAGDVDGDGQLDLVGDYDLADVDGDGVPEGGAVLFTSVPTGATDHTTATAQWHHEPSCSGDGIDLADLDGDGVDEVMLATSCSNQGQVFLIDDPSPGTTSALDASRARWLGGGREQLANVGDVDGDGIDDVYAFGHIVLGGSW